MRLECGCDITGACEKCAITSAKYRLSEMHKAGTITINHFFKAKDLDEPLEFVCQDRDCMYCRNR